MRRASCALSAQRSTWAAHTLPKESSHSAQLTMTAFSLESLLLPASSILRRVLLLSSRGSPASSLWPTRSSARLLQSACSRQQQDTDKPVCRSSRGAVQRKVHAAWTPMLQGRGLWMS